MFAVRGGKGEAAIANQLHHQLGHAPVKKQPQ